MSQVFKQLLHPLKVQWLHHRLRAAAGCPRGRPLCERDCTHATTGVPPLEQELHCAQVYQGRSNYREVEPLVAAEEDVESARLPFLRDSSHVDRSTSQVDGPMESDIHKGNAHVPCCMVQPESVDHRHTAPKAQCGEHGYCRVNDAGLGFTIETPYVSQAKTRKPII